MALESVRDDDGVSAGAREAMDAGDLPLVVRVAGLSAEVLAPFGDPRLSSLLAERERLAGEIDDLRARAVEALYRCLPEGAEEERPFLLALKRDVHNGRPLGGRRGHALWERAVARADALAELAEREDAAAAREEDFAAVHAEVEARERSALAAAAADPWLRRGLALASPDLVEALDRGAADAAVSGSGRRARRMETSLLRYVSRAALKLSPYSTLTPLGLAALRVPTGDGGAVRYLPGPRRERSLVRVKRYLLDQCCRWLFRGPGVLDRVPVRVNASLEDLGGGEYRFLRPPQLQAAPASDAGGLVKTPAAQVRVRLGGSLPSFLHDELSGAALPLPALAERVAARLGDGGAADRADFETGLRRLLDLGFLEVAPPWPGYEPSLEARLLELAETLPAGAVPPAALDALRELVDRERGFAAAADPAATVRRIDALIVQLYDSLAGAEPSGSSEPLEPSEPSRPALVRTESRSYYEDVFLAPEGPGGAHLLELDPRPLRRALDAADLVWRLGSLFEPRHDALLALDRYLESRHAGRALVPAAELFAETRGLWSAYRRHVDEGAAGPFDPYGLPAVADLAARREAVRGRLAGCIEAAAGEERLSASALGEILRELPPHLLPAVGPGLFLQPCDPRGESWVANGLFEGTGRMSCRFNVVLDPASRAEYLDGWTARSILPPVEGGGGEPVELIDLLFTKGNTVNVHWPQTRRVLLSPGETADLPPERVLWLRDLAVERRPGLPPRLVGPEGRRLVPCILTPLDVSFLPSALRFLDLFGVHAERGLPLPEGAEVEEGVALVRRRSIENLVLRRRHWRIEPSRLPAASPGPAGFAALDRWRRGLGLPEQVYLLESERREGGAGEAAKPQYVDFRSPSFAALFLAAVRRAASTTIVVEALPGREGFPVDPEVGPRACEVVLEWLALARPAGKAGPRRAPGS